MTLLEDTEGRAPLDERAPSPGPEPDDETIDLTAPGASPDGSPDGRAGDGGAADRSRPEAGARPEPQEEPPTPTMVEARPGEIVRVDPSGRMPRRGMRIRRVRLASVAKLALVFHTLGFVVVVATLVVLWNAARALGLVTSLEDLVVTSLGTDAFEFHGPSLFRLLVIGTAVLAAVGWLITVLLAAVYNASCAVFGGLAVETGPLRRRRRVFSLRHRRFVTIQA